MDNTKEKWETEWTVTILEEDWMEFAWKINMKPFLLLFFVLIMS